MPTWPCTCTLSCSVVSESLQLPRLFAHQAPLSMRFPKPEYWSGFPFPCPTYGQSLAYPWNWYQTTSLFWISAFFFFYHRDMQYGYLFIYVFKENVQVYVFPRMGKWEQHGGERKRVRRWCKMNIWYKLSLSLGPQICKLMCLLLETSQPHFKWKSKVNAETESQRMHFIYRRSPSCWVTGQDEYVFWF